jgi:hypothetical protein
MESLGIFKAAGLEIISAVPVLLDNRGPILNPVF